MSLLGKFNYCPFFRNIDDYTDEKVRREFINLFKLEDFILRDQTTLTFPTTTNEL